MAENRTSPMFYVIIGVIIGGAAIYLYLNNRYPNVIKLSNKVMNDRIKGDDSITTYPNAVKLSNNIMTSRIKGLDNRINSIENRLRQPIQDPNQININHLKNQMNQLGQRLQSMEDSISTLQQEIQNQQFIGYKNHFGML